MREYLHYICWIYIFRGTTASQPYIDLTKQVIQPHTDARTRTKSMEKNCLNKYANGYNEKKKWKWHLNEDSPTVGVNTKTWNERWKKDLTIIDVYNTYLLLINARHRMLFPSLLQLYTIMIKFKFFYHEKMRIYTNLPSIMSICLRTFHCSSNSQPWESKVSSIEILKNYMNLVWWV